MTTCLRRLFGSHPQSNNGIGKGSQDLSAWDTLTIFKALGYNNRTMRASEPINQQTSGQTNDKLTTDQDNATIRPSSSREFSLMFAEQTTLDGRSSFLTSYYGSSTGASNANVQRSISYYPSLQIQNFNHTNRAPPVRLAPTPYYPLKGSNYPPPSVPLGGPFQNRSKLPNIEEGKLSVSIDFGTTFSGVAFGSSRISDGRIQQILQWPGSVENFRKIPTCLLYSERGEVLAWGLEAKNSPPTPGSIRCECKSLFFFVESLPNGYVGFKLYLKPKCLRDGTADPGLPALPPGKQPIDTIVDFLSCLWKHAKQQITCETGAVADIDTANVWLTVPAAWDAKGCNLMREAAIRAGLVRSAGARGQDKNWRDRLRITTGPEAAAVHCAHLTDLRQLYPSQNFMICDAGGGTVDLAIYKILGSLESLEIGEVCARSGMYYGSLFLDLRFRDLVAKMLKRHPTDKLAFRGEEDDDTLFWFTCFSMQDPEDAAAGLTNGELAIPGALLRSGVGNYESLRAHCVFNPVISEVLQLIEDQLTRCNQPIHALLLVGGFSGSEYLFKRVDRQFVSRIGVIARPTDADTATCRGAARYGLANRTLVLAVIAPRAYMIKAKLPAKLESPQMRPAYVNINSAGVPVCDNRLQYLVQKDAVLRRGQRVKVKFCKFLQSPRNSKCVAVLYASDSERVIRYLDEGGSIELCRWTVDLSTLPVFTRRALVGPQDGFYTEFGLGLELDSAEVRGVLLYNGDEWGRVVFEFLN